MCVVIMVSIYHVLCRFSANENFKNCFRLSYSFYQPDVLRVAAKKVASVIKSHIQS